MEKEHFQMRNVGSDGIGGYDMAWTGLALTVEGRNALNQAQLSNTINFKSIVVGDGKAPANFGTQKGLVHQLYEITDIKVDVIDGGCTITADFPKVEYDYYFREIGIIVTADTGDILYVYDITCLLIRVSRVRAPGGALGRTDFEDAGALGSVLFLTPATAWNQHFLIFCNVGLCNIL